jgi:hypothetical protein
MFWAVRGTYEDGRDTTIVVEAETPAEAEYMGLRRAIPVIIVEPAKLEDIDLAREAKRLFITTCEKARKCFGRPIGRLQLACLIVCGIATIAINLHIAHVPIHM